MTEQPRGILKNAKEDATYKHESPNNIDLEKAAFDRKKVIENTRLNAKLTNRGKEPTKITSTDGEKLREKIQLNKRREDMTPEEQLKWDERNLLLNEQEKSATMKIDEPPTPYEGGFNPNNDYYRTDNEEDDEGDKRKGDDVEEELDEGVEDLDLGEGIDDQEVKPRETIEVVPQKEATKDEAAEGEHELSAEEKHKLFELKRKQHYHLKGEALHVHPVELDEDEDK